MNYIYFNLRTPISCQHLCSRIDSFINSIQNKDNLLLEIGIKQITEYNEIPKLGYTNSRETTNTMENNHEHQNQK